MTHSHSHHHHAEHDRERDTRRHGERGEQGGHGGPYLEAQATGSAEEVAGYLSALADALRAGGVTVRSGGRAVGLRLDGEVRLDLRAAAGDGGTSHLTLDLSWRAPQVIPPTPRLEILSTREAEQQRQHEQQGNGGGVSDEMTGTQETGLPG